MRIWKGIYQIIKKIAYHIPGVIVVYRKIYSMVTLTPPLCRKLIYMVLSSTPLFGTRFKKKIISQVTAAREIEFLLNASFTSADAGNEFLASLPLNTLLNREGLVRTLGKLQKEKLREILKPDRKTVAIYYPGRGYRENAGNITQRLQKKDLNVLTVIEPVCDDQYEKQEHTFYGGDNLIEDMDFIDVVIEVSPSHNLPGNSKSVYLVHDIHDSPLGGDMDTLSRFATGFDYLFLPSSYVIERFRKLIPVARKHLQQYGYKTKEICLIPGGYIKLDKNLEYFEENKQETKTIIYAPTITEPKRGGMGDITSVPEYGDRITAAILEHFPDYHLIFRPHPHDIVLPEVQKIAGKYKANPRFTFDDSGSFYMNKYAKSAIMVTDMSGTAYTYAFTTLRPVVFFSHDEAEFRKRYEGFKYIEDRSQIGYLAENIGEMVEKIELLLETRGEFTSKIKAYRDALIYNIGKSEDYFIDNFEYIISNKKHPDWIYM